MLGKIAGKPTPPDSIPDYVADGLQRQDQETLRVIIGHCEQLIDHYEREIDEEELADAREEVVDVEEDSDGTTVIKKVPCGKDCGGCPHGPYEYRVIREGDTLSWEYVGPA